MGTIERILCGTDLSEASGPAWAEAQRLAGLFDAELVLLHVIPPLVLPTDVAGQAVWSGDLYQRMLDEVDAEARDRIAQLAGRRTAESLKVSTRVEHGLPADWIMRVAADTPGKTLIVLGTHGRPTMGRVLLGSVADRVVRLASGPVITVRARPGGSSPGPSPLARICYATDFSPAARAVWPWVVTLADAAKAEIDVVSVVPEVAATRELSAATVGEITAGFRAHAEEQARRLVDVAPWLAARVHPVILGGPPAEAILASAEARGAGLIALGTRGRSGLRRWMLGSVALRLIQTASCPVLTLGPEAQAEDDRVLGS